MKERAREIIQQGDALFSAKQPLNWLHQQFAEQFYPMRADFTRTRYLSEEFASYAMTGKPFQVQRDLGNSFSAMLRPAGQEWFKAQTDREEINNDQQAKLWLEMATRVMRRVFADREVQFERATKQGDNDFACFGQTVLQVEVNRLGTKPLMRAWHLRDCAWAENADSQIDVFHRKWKIAARSMNTLFRGKVSQEVKNSLGKEPFKEFECRHIVLPTEEYDLTPGGKGENMKRRQAMKKDLPFVSIYVDTANEFILEETHIPNLGGYIIPRWQMAGSQYAYSPAAVVGLPDARMLQQMSLTLLEAGQKIVDPPMIAVGEAINGGINLFAGGQTYVDPDYDERTGEVLRPITLRGEGLQWGGEREKIIQEALTEAFYLNKIALPEISKDMTAYETQKRFEEYIRQATLLFEPVSSEYNGGVCEEFFGVCLRNGAFGSPLDMPPILRGQNVHFGFESPIKSAQGKATAEAFGRLAQLLGAAMQIDQNSRFIVKVPTAFRDAATGTGAKATWINTEEDADKLTQQAQAQQQAQQQAEQVGSTAEGIGKIGQAAKNVGDASTAMQEAGLA
jgi:hypothetical protein